MKKRIIKNLSTKYLQVLFVLLVTGTILLAPQVFTSTGAKIDSVAIKQLIYEAKVRDLQLKTDSAKAMLANEISKYINKVAPKSKLNSRNIIDLCDKYDVDIRLVLAQGHIESHFGTKGTAKRTNSVFNVGAYDGHSANKQIKNGYGFTHPDYSVEPYLKLLKERYLVNNKTEQDLLKRFVDKNGNRYASAPQYESFLRAKWRHFDNKTNISKTYNEYNNFKKQLKDITT